MKARADRSLPGPRRWCLTGHGWDTNARNLRVPGRASTYHHVSVRPPARGLTPLGLSPFDSRHLQGWLGCERADRDIVGGALSLLSAPRDTRKTRRAGCPTAGFIGKYRSRHDRFQRFVKACGALCSRHRVCPLTSHLPRHNFRCSLFRVRGCEREGRPRKRTVPCVSGILGSSIVATVEDSQRGLARVAHRRRSTLRLH